MWAATVSRQRSENLRGHLLVQLYILLELRNDGARQHVHFALFIALQIGHGRDFGGEEFAFDQLLDGGAVDAFDQHLDRAVRKLEQLQNRGHGADAVQILALRIVDVGLFLRDQENPLVGLHGQIERDDGFLPPDEQRDHHVRVHHHVAQRQHGHAGLRGGYGRNIDFGFVAH